MLYNTLMLDQAHTSHSYKKYYTLDTQAPTSTAITAAAGAVYEQNTPTINHFFFFANVCM